jgi:hypothetical protein
LTDRSLRPADTERYSDDPSTPLWYPDPTGDDVLWHLDGDLIFRDRAGTTLIISAVEFRRQAWLWKFTPTQSGAGIRARLEPSTIGQLEEMRRADK